MKGVTESEFFAERIQQNPSNQERLLSMKHREFIDVMQRWRNFFTADKPVIGATEAELKTIGVPMVIIPGDDDTHPRAVGENLHSILPHSELHPPLWSQDEAEKLRQQDPAKFQEMGHEQRASIFLAFLEKVEAAHAPVH